MREQTEEEANIKENLLICHQYRVQLIFCFISPTGECLCILREPGTVCDAKMASPKI